MKKVAVVSYGHVDVSLNLVKKLKSIKDFEITLYLIFAQNKRKESIVNFDNVEVKDGFLGQHQVHKILGEELCDYIDDKFKVEIFIYNSLKFRSIRNAFLSIKLIIRLLNYSTIHFSGTAGTLLHIIPFVKHKNCLATIHDYRLHSGEKNKYGIRIQEYIIKNIKKIIIQNKADYDIINNEHPDKSKNIYFIPFGYLDVYRAFDNNIENPELKSDVLFFGRISKYKGIEYLLESISILGKKGVSLKVILAGSGDYDFGLEKLKSMPNITFFDEFVENTLLVQLIKGSKIILCPYTDATQSGVLMTTFPFGKPVIASDVGSFSELIINDCNGYLVPPKDSVSLSKAINKLLSEPELLSTMKNNIKEMKGIEEYSWKKIAEKVYKLYE